MGVKLDKVKSELELRSFGQKGWLSNKDISCPDCGRKGKFGIKFVNKSGLVHCFYCDYSTSIYNFLKSIGRLDLTTNEIKNFYACHYLLNGFKNYVPKCKC